MVEELQDQGSVSVLHGELEGTLTGRAVGKGNVVRSELGSSLIHFPEHIEERLGVRLDVTVEGGKAIHILPKMSAGVFLSEFTKSRTRKGPLRN